ncbi:MAG: hypothetical protein J1F41_09765 [Lachnospiraceae bacterium]|nr:hypothetical protein [Lachnospiraceae bacterium]
MMDKKESYFEAALSDFMFDVAAGGAIRHLVDRGYSIEQIMKRLDYPVPRPKVEKAVYRHLMESGILLSKLPEEDEKIKIHLLQEKDREKLSRMLAEHIEKYGEHNSYMECPFGQWSKNNAGKLQQVLASLSAREREYILGIRWEYPVMYHRLNSRMREIGMKLAGNTDEEWRFYFWN